MTGITYNIQCPHCGKKYEITYGASLLYTNRALTISSLYNRGKPFLDYLIKSRKILSKTFELLNNGYSLDSGYEHAMYYCSHCQKIYSRFSFTLSKDEKIWEPTYTCWRCKRKLEKIAKQNFKNIKISCSCKHEISLSTSDDVNPEEWS